MHDLDLISANSDAQPHEEKLLEVNHRGRKSCIRNDIIAWKSFNKVAETASTSIACDDYLFTLPSLITSHKAHRITVPSLVPQINRFNRIYFLGRSNQAHYLSRAAEYVHRISEKQANGQFIHHPSFFPAQLACPNIPCPVLIERPARTCSIEV